MIIGLKPGTLGAVVERLHRVLTSIGHRIEPGETERSEFGPSTLDALHSFQNQRGLPVSDEVDASTHAVLLDVEKNITINVVEATSPATLTTPHVQNEHRGTVQGKLADEDGAPLAGRRVSAFAKHIRTERHLGDATTGKQGQYRISYHRPSAVNLVVRAYDVSETVVAQSATAFAAPARVRIDITTAASGVVASPSTFTTVGTAVAALLEGTPLTELKENKDTHELQFLANAAAVPFDDVAYLFMANALGAKNDIRAATLFGVFFQGVPPSLDGDLASLPDGGIDDAFMAQALSGVLAHSRASLSLTLTAAVNANAIPASYAATQDSELTRLDALRTQSVGSAPYLGGAASLNDLLAAGGVSEAVKTAFTQAYADNAGQLGPAWTTLRANEKLPAAELATLDTTLSAGELLAGSLPLIKDTLSRLSQTTLGSLQDLALLNASDWVARITAVDPEATSIPGVVPNETAQQKIARFADSLATRLAGRYPTTAFLGGLSKAETSSFAKTKPELVAFLTAHPTLDLRNTSIDSFIATNKAAITAPALADLKTAQRLFRVSPQHAMVEALKTAGYQSAQSVYFKGRDPFLAEMTAALGGASSAAMVYARAQMTYATALMAFGRYNQAFHGIVPSAARWPPPDPSALTNLPDLQALFGSLDYFECEDCQSVVSPAAYLVDLLQYLGQFTASGSTPDDVAVGDARQALLLRRPDIQYIGLDCNNTKITLPYIDLVNEIFEAAIDPLAPAVTLIDTTGTSAERRALPQQISQNAYKLTAQAVFPLSLPFDLGFAQTTAYIGALGATRAAMLALFAGNPVGSDAAAAIAGARLGINPELQKVIVGKDTHQAWDRWGLAQNPDWVAALSSVPVLLNRAGLTLRQLYQLLEVVWVTQSGVILRAGITNSGGVNVLSPDTDAMVFTGLTADVLDRANRFLRLWKAAGLRMWELDWALEWAAGGILDDAFLVFLSGAMAVQTRLKLPFQEVLSFWMPLETRDVTNHLGDEDTMAPSTYSEVFRNPAVLAKSSSVFVPLSQSIIVDASHESPIVITTSDPHGYQTGMKVTISGVVGNPAAFGTFAITVVDPESFSLNGTTGNGDYQSGGIAKGALSGATIVPDPSSSPTPEENALAASLALSAGDISAILAFTFADNVLSPETLNVLLRYQRLSSALSLGISDLILWIQLTGGQPFNGAPADTLEFLRRLAVLQGTGLGVHDLDYLIRDQSTTLSALAFTDAQATTVLQTIRDAVAKLPGATTIAIAAASNTSPIVIGTALPNGLQTGAQVSISGVLENTAANGTFTIDVQSQTSFGLDGSQANGTWTSGGTIGFFTAAVNPAAIQTIFVDALATATGTTANVVTPVLLKTKVLPLDTGTISLLVAQDSGVDPAQFPGLIDAFTEVAKAAALFTALKPTEAEFAFVVQNAGTFNWYDPSQLPVSPANTSPYTPFEALLLALKLNRRQPARTPKLFDILGEWLPPHSLPADLPTAIGAINIMSASGTAPIEITTESPHRLQTGMRVTISGVRGNTVANGEFNITVTDKTKFTLDGSKGTNEGVPGGTVLAPCLAVALNASVNDVIAIAEKLGAKPPSLTAVTLAGSLADVVMLASISSALDVAVRYGIGGATLVQLAAVPATADAASAAMGALQAQYPQNAWFGAIQPVEDTLRQNRRDALVAYLLGPGPAAPTPPLLTTGDIFNYYLIDPEMCPCAQMTRLLQASLAIQQFVQQCFLNLFFSNVKVDLSNSHWKEWPWRQQFDSWRKNREVFLYPENYLLPELRRDASPFFSDLENDLRQSNCDAAAADAAMENYLRKLVGVANLQVAAHCNQTKPDGSIVLHVFACTNGTPPQWYYRTRTKLAPAADPAESNGPPGAGSWSAWESLNLDIAAQHLLPVVWDQRLHLIWPVFKPVSEKQSDQKVPTGGGGNPQSAPRKFWTVEFAMSELSAGQWQPKRTSAEKMFLDSPDSPLASPLAFTFRAQQDDSFNLQLQVFFCAIEDAIAKASVPPPGEEQSALSSAVASAVTTDPGVIWSAIQAALTFGLDPALAITQLAAAVAQATATDVATVHPSFTNPANVLGSTATVQFTWNGQSWDAMTISSKGNSDLVASASLPMPESPLSVREFPDVLPGGQLVDLSQEPTFALVVTDSTLSGTLMTTDKYGFSGQDLVFGNYTQSNPGKQLLNLLCAPAVHGQLLPVDLLGAILKPRIVIPQGPLSQPGGPAPAFDSTTAFFIADPTRTYLVTPHFYANSSSTQEITSLAGLSQWYTSYVFETFYHPFARTFLRELEIGGVAQLMARSLQVHPPTVRGWTFDFQTYGPKPAVATPFPGYDKAPDPGESALDFAPASSGAYSLYNWEVFYHIPMFVASLLMQNQQYQDAMTWLEYIFNPTDSSVGTTLPPQRFWQMAPLNAMYASDWIDQEIQNILTTLAVDTKLGIQGINDSATITAIEDWWQNPFDPQAIASLRISAYGKATVMKFLDNLIAWGDWYYNQYTAEKVSQAEQLYILADMLLGPRPQMLRLPKASQSGAGIPTYASLQDIDKFSNALVNVENVIVAPEPSLGLIQGTAQAVGPSLYFPARGTPQGVNTLLFCIPPNQQLLAYWDTVSQRLYNIRHCLNLQGVPQPLPLYAGENPFNLTEAGASGGSFGGATPAAPIYRFPIYLQKAVELNNDVRAYGSLILSALEKQDAELLAVLRANQETDIQTRMQDVKTMQVTEAQDQIAALQNQKAVVQIRYNFYSAIAFMNAWETAAIELQGAAMISNGAALILDMTSGVAHMIPTFEFGASGFGGTPLVTATFGGENIAAATSSWASVARGLGGILSEAGGMAATLGGYQRRMDEWNLQANLADAELTQMDSQIAAATDRLSVATKELDIQKVQVSNAQAVSHFLTTKYTNSDLYSWMVSQLTTVYTQAYQLAFSLALQAQNAYQYELGSQDAFIQFGYWDSQHKGLCAGESLLFDLRRMEGQYLAGNSREHELTKHVSLALTSPTALVMLRETGRCQIALDEALFDCDHPGQYFRRIRSVALTIPCVTGPYTGVNATLRLINAIVRIQAPGAGYQPQSASALPPNDPTVVSSPMAAAGTQTIATSGGQNDAGLFDVNLRDERWLPFEGQGAISAWHLVLDPRDNSFDFSTITDIVLHVRYTARGGGDKTAADIVRNALKPLTSRSILVSVRNTFGSAYYTFFNPADTTANQQTLTLPITEVIFPFSNLGGGGVNIEGIAFYIVLSVVPAAADAMDATFSIEPVTSPASSGMGNTAGGATLSFAPAPGHTNAGNAITALTASASIPAPVAAPQSLIVTIPAASVPSDLTTKVNAQTRLDPAKIEDILLIIKYSIL